MAKPLSCLLITIQTEAGLQKKVVDKNPFTIGRSLEAAIAFSDNNISRTHVLVKNKGGKVIVEDQGSANGTYVNGTRIEARRATAVEPKDVVRLGNSKIELTFTPVEKVFNESQLETAELTEEEKDSILNLIEGAHAEAERLIKVGKDLHDNIIKTAEDRRRITEQNLILEREQVLNEARENATESIEQARIRATQMITAAEEDARRAVAHIHKQAEDTRAQADDYYDQQVGAAQTQSDAVIKQSELICEEMLKETKSKIQEITEAAKSQSQALIQKSQHEAIQIEQEAKQQSEALIADTEKLKAKVLKEIERLQLRAQEESNLLIKQSQKASDKLKEDSENEAASVRSLAESDARHIRAEAHQEADQLKIDALSEAETIKIEAHREGERRAAEALAEALEQGRIKSDEMMLHAREKMQIERDTLISHAEEQLRETRHEKKKIEGELATQVKRLKGEIEQLNSELENQQRLMQQKRKVFDDEVAYLRDLKEREAQAIFDEKLREAEILIKQKYSELEKTKLVKEEETELFVQSKKLEYEKIKRRSEEEIADLNSKIKELTPQCQHHTQELKELQELISQAKHRVSQLEPQATTLAEQIATFEKQKLSFIESIKDLEQKNGHLARENENINIELEKSKRNREAYLSEQKALLEAELTQLKRVQQQQLDQLKLDEMNRIKRAREDMMESLMRDRNKIGLEIFNQIELEVVKFSKSSDWIAASPQIQQKIQEALEEKSINVVTSQQADQTVSSMAIAKRRRNERWIWATQGLMAGLILYYGVQSGYDTYLNDANPMKSAALEEARIRAEDLERRKFNPEKGYEWKTTYAENVIYKLNFYENYLNSDFQNALLKASTAYLLKQWRIEEEKTIEVLSMTNTLVTTIEEKKLAIHPDYINDGLKKINELEAETLTRLKDTLGGEVRLEAYRRFEKRFYEQYFEGQPGLASSDSSGETNLSSKTNEELDQTSKSESSKESELRRSKRIKKPKQNVKPTATVQEATVKETLSEDPEESIPDSDQISIDEH